jgi:hypothetical protein
MKEIIKSIIEDMRARYVRGSQRRVKRLERLRAAITHILLLQTEYAIDSAFISDEKLVGFCVSFIREMGAYLRCDCYNRQS